MQHWWTSAQCHQYPTAKNGLSWNKTGKIHYMIDNGWILRLRWSSMKYPRALVCLVHVPSLHKSTVWSYEVGMFVEFILTLTFWLSRNVELLPSKHYITKIFYDAHNNGWTIIKIFHDAHNKRWTITKILYDAHSNGWTITKILYDAHNNRWTITKILIYDAHNLPSVLTGRATRLAPPLAASATLLAASCRLSALDAPTASCTNASRSPEHHTPAQHTAHSLVPHVGCGWGGCLRWKWLAPKPLIGVIAWNVLIRVVPLY